VRTRQATCDCGHECDQWYPVTRAVLSLLPSCELFLKITACILPFRIFAYVIGYYFGYEFICYDILGLPGLVHDWFFQPEAIF
jgi:hypothetical protein